MSRIFFTATLAILLSSINICAQTPFNWDERIEYTGVIDKSDLYKIDSLGIYSIDKIIGSSAYFNLNKKQYYWLKSLGIEIYPDTRKSASMIQALTMATSTAGMSGWNAYPTYSTYLQMMEDFQTNYPSLCRIDTIGYSKNNRLILAAKISDNVNTDESKPEFLYTSSMHGDEVAGIVITLRLIDYMLSNYGSDNLITKLIDSVEIYINPMANPDGTYAGGDNTIASATRRNANGVDLNRNFPDPASGDHPDGNAWQPENIAMMDYMDSRNFSLSMNFHGGEQVLNYPWDRWSRLHADNDWYYLISREFADTVHSYSTGYMTGFDNGVTNGYAWYTIDGGRQDYVNYYKQGREITFEITTTKLYDSNSLPALWDYNHRSLLNYIKQTIYGIHGNITDTTGSPLYAKIEILNHDKDNSHVFSDTDGIFYRYLKAGTYNIQVTAPSFDTLVVNNVSITDFHKYEMNLVLNHSIGTSAEDIKGHTFSIYPNPSNGRINISYPESISCFNTTIFNTQGVKVFTYENASDFITVENLTPGVYIIMISDNKTHETFKIVIE